MTASRSTNFGARQGARFTASNSVACGPRCITWTGRSPSSPGPKTARTRGAGYACSTHHSWIAASRRATAASSTLCGRGRREAVPRRRQRVALEPHVVDERREARADRRVVASASRRCPPYSFSSHWRSAAAVSAHSRTLGVASWARRSSSETHSSARAWVDFEHHGGAAPASNASTHRSAQTHHWSSGCKPANPKAGCGVERSLPAALLKARKLSVTRAHTTWTPRSSPPVSQHPLR